MSAKRSAIAREVALWILSLFLAWVFVRQGFSKFSDDSGWARAFRAWHYPDWFRILIGVVEVSAAALLFVRRFALVGAVMIMVVMLGGMATHVWWGRPRQVTSEVLPLTLATIVAIGRRRHFFARRREGDV
jgi:uncharacterized membrane protein YphA (DoxX/SURF4 family)